MREEKLEKLFNELTDAAAEQVRPGLADEIKHQIPADLSLHRRGLDTINVVIDLRINKLTAAAVIIIAIFLFMNFFAGQHSTGSIVADGKLLMSYLLGDTGSITTAATGRSKYAYLVPAGQQAVYYGNNAENGDSNTLLMHWKISDGKYRVIFTDMHAESVSSEKLIELQVQMLQNKKE